MFKKGIRANSLHGSLIRLNKTHRKMAKIEFNRGKTKIIRFYY